MQGYLVGNGVTDDVFDGNALVPFAHGMGLISDDLFQVGSSVDIDHYIASTNIVNEISSCILKSS